MRLLHQSELTMINSVIELRWIPHDGRIQAIPVQSEQMPRQTIFVENITMQIAHQRKL